MTKKMEKLLETLMVPPGKKIDLRKDYDSGFTGDFLSKDEIKDTLTAGVELLSLQQDKLYAQDTYALLIIIQAMDAAGKDSTIKHVMSGVNPQGVQITSFKVPSEEELNHDYLWRNFIALPRRGNIGIFNRSYYEEVLVVKVHPDILAHQRIPKELITADMWKERYENINAFERHLTQNGTTIVKFFLNVSKEEQRRRFIDRLDEKNKNWKFSSHDVQERAHWKEYMRAYEEAIRATSTKWAPWYVIPADYKWFSRAAVSDVIVHTLGGMILQYPIVSAEETKSLAAAKKELLAEG